MPQPSCMQRKTRFPRSAIVCFLRHRIATSLKSSNPTAHLNMTRNICGKCSKCTRWMHSCNPTSISSFRMDVLRSLSTQSAAKFVGCPCSCRCRQFFLGAAMVLATHIYNCTPHRRLGVESLHYQQVSQATRRLLLPCFQMCHCCASRPGPRRAHQACTSRSVGRVFECRYQSRSSRLHCEQSLNFSRKCHY